jgi:hypothetical protein
MLFLLRSSSAAAKIFNDHREYRYYDNSKNNKSKVTPDSGKIAKIIAAEDEQRNPGNASGYIVYEETQV